MDDIEYIARIQQKTFEDLRQPYPYFIEENGLVGRQEFWNGKPYELLGFNRTTKTGEISSPFKEFKKDINAAIGMFPVFKSKTGMIETHTNPVVKVNL